MDVQANRIQTLARDKQLLEERQEGYGPERAALEAELGRIQELLERKTEQARALERELEEERGRAADLAREGEAREAELSRTIQEVATLRERLGRESARLATLTELQEKLDGYDEGVRALVASARGRQGDGRLPALHALAAEIFETDPGYETAIEAALNGRSQAVVVDGPEEACRGVAYLKEADAGRGTFLPLAPRKRGDAVLPPPGSSGVVAPALDLVRYDPRYAEVARALLGHVVVVEDLEAAVALFRSNGHACTMVTLAGEVLDPAGVVEGGSVRSNTSGFIRRRREIREITLSLEVLRRDLARAEQERSRALDQASAVKERIREVQESLRGRAERRAGVDKEAAALAAEAAHLRRGLENLAREHQERTRRILALEEELASARHDHQTLERERAEAQDVVRVQAQRLAELRERLERERGDLTGVQVDLAALHEKQGSVAHLLENQEQRAADLEGLAEGRSREVREVAARIERTRADKAETEARIQERIRRKDELTRTLAEARDEFETRREALQAEQADFKDLHRRREELERRLHEIEVRRTEVGIKIEHLRDRARERYQVDLAALVPEYRDREIDADAARQRLDELHASLEKMGPVNLTAIQEYQELTERFDFLTTQEADLQESVETLLATIRKINRTSRQRFQEAFEAVNAKFREVFVELFQGGHAELRLEEGEEILEAGVEIIAQPPGKKLQNLSLLSGGEKALAAVALIFAGFLVKPSPFCLLDEVDAPLDEANVERYNALLRRLAEQTQFIVITHNKKSMEHADALYGITMQEPGISKMVSVRLHDAVPHKASA